MTSCEPVLIISQATSPANPGFAAAVGAKGASCRVPALDLSALTEVLRHDILIH